MVIIKFIDRLLNFIVFTFFFVAMAFSCYALFDVYTVYENSELTDDILKYRPSTQGENSFGNKFSLDDLKPINEDIVGWVRVDGTNIDYPILAGENNSTYLKSDYKKDYSPAGSIFLDYRNNRNLEDDYFVIYGHNMSKGLMFSDIKKFENEDFFNEHKSGKLYTAAGVYDLTIITFNIVDANKSIVYKLQKYSNGHNKEIVDTLMRDAIYKREIDGDSKLVLLSTCYGVGSYDRSVLLAKIDKTDDSNFIKDDTRKREEAEFEKMVIKNQKKQAIINRIFVFIIYLFLAGILYLRIMILHKKKKKKSVKK